MKIQEKPDYLIFAESAKKGEVSDFPDVSRGWGITIEQTGSKPPMEWMNGAFNRVDKNMLYLLQQGVPEWNKSVKYPANAIIKYNGVLYTAIVENDNSNPAANTTKWKKTQAEVSKASTTQSGIVKLSSATNSESETEAATPKAVKSAYDLASNALKKSGDEMTGQLRMSAESAGIKFKYADSSNEFVLRTLSNSLSFIFYDEQQKAWSTKLAYITNKKQWVFQSVDDVTINNKSVLKIGDYGLGSLTGAPIANPDDRLLSGWYATKTSDFADLSGNDSATLAVYGSSHKNFYVEQLFTVASKTPRIFSRCATPEGKQPFYESITTANINNYLPVGIPQPWPTTTPPDGWLKCNGWRFDKNKYPKLATVYPSGNLPDLRGEFIRGWDDGKGTDPGRGILSWQGDAIRNIWGELETFVTGATNSSNSAGVFRTTVNSWPAYQPAAQGGGTHQKLTLDASTQVPTSHENRPRNLAFMYILKAE